MKAIRIEARVAWSGQYVAGLGSPRRRHSVVIRMHRQRRLQSAGDDTIGAAKHNTEHHARESKSISPNPRRKVSMSNDLQLAIKLNADGKSAKAELTSLDGNVAQPGRTTASSSAQMDPGGSAAPRRITSISRELATARKVFILYRAAVKAVDCAEVVACRPTSGQV